VVDSGGIQDALGADGGLRHRNGQSRAPVAERISWGREPDPERSDQGSASATLAEIAQRLGRKALEELAAVAKPDTLLAWYRKLIANKFDGSRIRQRAGRPRIDEEAERLVVQMAKENPGWGYDRIVGALANLGFLPSDQTVGNILRRHGLSPAPKRKQAISWKDFTSHMEVLVGTDF
jgi:putative transposase